MSTRRARQIKKKKIDGRHSPGGRERSREKESGAWSRQGSGKKTQPSFSLPGNSRKTIKVNDVAGMGGTDFSTQVHGSKAIIAERAMYWDNGGAGTDTIGGYGD